MNALAYSRTPSGAETLFASSAWFDLWLVAFGTSDCGWWPAAANDTRFRIAYCRETRRIGPLRVAVATAAANSHTPRYDVCGEGAPTGEFSRAMMRDLGVVALVFPYVSEHSRLARAAAPGSYRHMCEVAPYVDCSTGTFDDYLDSRGKTRKKSWLYYERRATKTGARFEVVETWAEIELVFDALLAIESSGWKGRAGTSIVQDEATRTFYVSLCRSLAEQGRLRIFLLRKGEQIIAFQICTLFEGTLSCLKIGYLDGYQHESPGQVIQLQIVRWAFARDDVRVFDLLGPASDTKLKWATGSETLWTYYFFAASARGALAAMRFRHAPRVKSAIVSLARGLRRSDPAPAGDDPEPRG